MHLTNRDIAYISNGTDPNTLGIVPVFNLGRCVTEDGTQEWNYNSALAPGSRWVLKTNSSVSEHWFLSRFSHTISMQYSTPVIFEFNYYSNINPNKFELIAASPITGLRALQNFTGIVNGQMTIYSPVSSGIDIVTRTGTSGLFSFNRETLVADSYRTIAISVPYAVSNAQTIRLELALSGATPPGLHNISFTETRLNFSVLT